MTTNVDQASTPTPAADSTPAAPVTPPEGATPDGNTQAETVESLPEWAQKLVRSLRRENEKRRQEADTERQQAEEKRLADAQQWQELAAKREQERDELKPYKERYEALAAQQRAALVAVVAKWPAEVRALLPGDDADVQALADAVDKARAVVAALDAKATTTPAHGTPPPPAGRAGLGADQEEARRRMTASLYRNL